MARAAAARLLRTRRPPRLGHVDAPCRGATGSHTKTVSTRRLDVARARAACGLSSWARVLRAVQQLAGSGSRLRLRSGAGGRPHEGVARQRVFLRALDRGRGFVGREREGQIVGQRERAGDLLLHGPTREDVHGHGGRARHAGQGDAQDVPSSEKDACGKGRVSAITERPKWSAVWRCGVVRAQRRRRERQEHEDVRRTSCCRRRHRQWRARAPAPAACGRARVLGCAFLE